MIFFISSANVAFLQMLRSFEANINSSETAMFAKVAPSRRLFKSNWMAFIEICAIRIETARASLNAPIKVCLFLRIRLYVLEVNAAIEAARVNVSIVLLSANTIRIGKAIVVIVVMNFLSVPFSSGWTKDVVSIRRDRSPDKIVAIAK